MINANIENSGEESSNDSILNLDLDPDGVICPFMFEPQHNSSLGEEEIFVQKKFGKHYKEKHLHAHILEILLWQLSRDAIRKQVCKLSRNECTM